MATFDIEIDDDAVIEEALDILSRKNTEGKADWVGDIQRIFGGVMVNIDGESIGDMAMNMAVALQNEPDERKRELLDAIYDNSDSRIANLYG